MPSIEYEPVDIVWLEPLTSKDRLDLGKVLNVAVSLVVSYLLYLMGKEKLAVLDNRY
jgi:hypothetical protein